jgi:hypothetical protein
MPLVIGTHTENGVKFFLEWYARLDILEKKILKCIKDTWSSVAFEAEL